MIWIRNWNDHSDAHCLREYELFIRKIFSCNSRKVFGLWQASLNGQLFKYIAKIWGSIMKEEGDFVASLGINNPKFTV